MTNAIETILAAIDGSSLLSYEWNDRGVAPNGYIQGMALMFARVYCKLAAGDKVALKIAMPVAPKSESTDGLAWLSGELNTAHVSEQSILVQVFTILIGLGMRESSGCYCEGRDRTVSHPTADTAEAGLFQASWNLAAASPELTTMPENYQDKDCFVAQFKKGLNACDNELETVGQGSGQIYQHLAMKCPAFATEFAALGLRLKRDHWGPINRKEVEVCPLASDMFLNIQAAIVANTIKEV